MKLIVAGGREFKDYQLMIKHLHYYVEYHKKSGIVVLHGASRGADKMAAQYMKDWGVPTKPFPYESEYGTKGGPIRNKKMAKEGDELIAFWDGESPGTKNMLDCMARLKKPFKVVYYETVERT